MSLALAQADLARQSGEVPVGAVLVQNDQVIASGFNACIHQYDPSAHAELVAIRNAGKALKNYRLGLATLYVTLEPCPMCMGAIMNARISRLVYGASDPKAGACGSVIDLGAEPLLNHHTAVTGGVLRNECLAVLQSFFQAKRLDASQRLQRVASLSDIPNLDKTLIQTLQANGFSTPLSLSTLDIESFYFQHAGVARLETKHLAMLMALNAFIAGEPVQSWGSYESSASTMIQSKGKS